MHLILIFLSAALVNNFVLMRFLGLCPFLGVSKKMNVSLYMGLAVTVVIVLSAAAGHVAYNFALVPLGLEYLHLLVFIIVIASLVQLLEIILRKVSPSLFSNFGVFLPLMTTNCIIVGVVIINMGDSGSFMESVVNAFGGGIGFLIAITIFAGIRERLEENDVPDVFKGFPIATITAGLMSIVFMGFAGLI